MNKIEIIDDVGDVSEFSHCPNCDALISPSITVCPSCGVNILRFLDALPRMQVVLEEHAAKHSAQLASESVGCVKEEVHKGKMRFQSLLIWLSVVLIATIGLGSLFTVGYKRYQQLRHQRVVAFYARGQACRDVGDLDCALDNLEKVVKREPDYSDAKKLLRQTRISLWSRAIQAKDWPEAASLMEAVLSMDKSDEHAAFLLDQTYRLWLRGASKSHRWGTFVFVWFRRRIWGASRSIAES
jgi:tetratricopeptide (TPR) repeat protein